MFSTMQDGSDWRNISSPFAGVDQAVLLRVVTMTAPEAGRLRQGDWRRLSWGRSITR